MTEQASTTQEAIWRGGKVIVMEPDHPGGCLVKGVGPNAETAWLVPREELTFLDEPCAAASNKSAISTDDYARAKARADACRRIMESPTDRATSVGVEAEKLGISTRTLYREIKKFLNTARVSALLPKKPGRPQGAKLLETRVEEIVRHYLDDVFLQENRPEASQVIEEIQAACRREGLTPPCEKTVRRRIAQLNATIALKRRHGAKVAKYTRDPFINVVEVDNPLDKVQIDHTLANVMLVSDDEDRLELGRPWVTFAIDIKTRGVVGYHVGFDPPSSMVTALCVADALTPKEEQSATSGQQAAWPFFGAIRCFHTDNGADFRADALKAGCAEVGADIEFRVGGNPHHGGHIERLMGTLAGLCRLLPGCTQRDSREKGDYDAQEEATMTLNEFREWLNNELVIYHRRKHRELNMTPIRAWSLAIEKGFKPRPLPPGWTLRETFINFLPFEHRFVRRTGLQLWDLQYWTSELTTWIGDKVKRKIFYDPRDITRAYMKDPSGRIVELKVTKKSIGQWSLQEWRVLRKEQSRIDPELQAERDEALGRRRELIKQAEARTEAARKSAGARKAKAKRDQRRNDVKQMHGSEGVNESPARDAELNPKRAPTKYTTEAWR